jgi:uncharacterized protein with HEPN domain
MVRRAVEREFEVIGEAVNRLLKLDDSIEIEDGRRIVDLRNFIIHAYDEVNEEILWGIILNNLPTLKSDIKRLLDESE